MKFLNYYLVQDFRERLEEIPRDPEVPAPIAVAAFQAAHALLKLEIELLRGSLIQKEDSLDVKGAI
jgi:hypothetical protein